jgi:hypothetical protein
MGPTSLDITACPTQLIPSQVRSGEVVVMASLVRCWLFTALGQGVPAWQSAQSISTPPAQEHCTHPPWLGQSHQGMCLASHSTQVGHLTNPKVQQQRQNAPTLAGSASLGSEGLPKNLFTIEEAGFRLIWLSGSRSAPVRQRVNKCDESVTQYNNGGTSERVTWVAVGEGHRGVADPARLCKGSAKGWST